MATLERAYSILEEDDWEGVVTERYNVNDHLAAMLLLQRIVGVDNFHIENTQGDFIYLAELELVVDLMTEEDLVNLAKLGVVCDLGRLAIVL